MPKPWYWTVYAITVEGLLDGPLFWFHWAPRLVANLGGVKRRNKPSHVDKNRDKTLGEVYCPGNGMNDLLFGYVWFNVSWYTCRSLVTALRLSWPRNCEVQVPYRQVLLDSGRDAWHEPRSLPIIGFFAELFNNHRPNRNNSRAPAGRAFSVNGPVFGHRGVDSRHRRGGCSGKVVLPC